jgi:hypothetical protein
VRARHAGDGMDIPIKYEKTVLFPVCQQGGKNEKQHTDDDSSK